ncbi:MAG: hypothetical protein JO154_23325 [Chitinophaga sp.]|uniref:hypothetical protein n=1 Tax=Chitinophaga sp. TaxID=1869181 RepID=UPI0025C278B8|nr:hypothetical protein [Chitinophaga sp.]MBV8255548.1 hypothetical protein [Chitinophaga sp.]
MIPDQEKETEETLWQRMREMFFPIKPTDNMLQKTLKNSAFYLGALMVGLVTLALAAAITFVL